MHTYQSVPVEGWESQNIVTFVVDSVPKESYYYMTLGIRTTNQYPFQSLWLQVKQRWFNPDTSLVDTVKCVLMDRLGNEYGDGIGVKQNVFDVCHIHLYSNQVGMIQVSHIMRRSILEGVSDVGIRIRDTQ